MEQITKEELVDAYVKLKTYIYYDTTELFQRRALAEFETGILTNRLLFHSPYNEGLFGIGGSKLDEKFEEITKLINGYNKDKKSFEKYFKKIDLIYLPKKFTKEKKGKTFITNKRTEDKYTIDRITVFADVPIELLLVSVVWIIRYGWRLDKTLSDSCIGNRLVLTKEKDGIVKGSSLFKPYFHQYQKWRDNAVDEAQRKLEIKNDVAVINLDLKDYFYSVHLDFDDLDKSLWPTGKKPQDPIHEIFKEIHFHFTNKLLKNKYPYPELAKELNGKTVLPIGIPSSYVLANWYLKEFDKRISQLIPHSYYSRYVDDVLILITNPDFDFHSNEPCEGLRFDFEKYLKDESSERISFSKQDLTNIEAYILETFYPIIKLVDFPERLRIDRENPTEDEDRIFMITCIEGAYFQSNKTSLHFFDHNESTAVIDKLKEELEERSSEFRDFPDEQSGDISFDEQAYHLIFDGSEGKIRTLKDYKENRYGLSVFLANRIFSALRREKKVDREESNKLLKLFKGLNNLEYFRLWEKIFTFFLVNDDKAGFVAFYKHTFDEINKLDITKKIQSTEIEHSKVSSSLLRYFDIALEMTLALNPGFLKYGTKVYKDLEVFQNKHNWIAEWLLNVRLTKPNSFYITRFRRSNLIRHHYVAHPLLNYCKVARSNKLNLVNRHFPRIPKFKQEDLEFSDASKLLSPRRVKFWECCIAVVIQKVMVHSSKLPNEFDGRHQFISLFNNTSEQKKSFVLNEAFDLYKEINKYHFSSSPPERNRFFKIDFEPFRIKQGQQEVEINEIRVNEEYPFNKPIRISVANTEVKLEHIESSIKGSPILNHSRYEVFAKLLRESRKENADLFILPEFSVPYEFVSSLAKYSETNQMAIIAGLEHWTVRDVAYNFIVTIIPITVDGVKDAVVIYRLKNHYAHVEELLVRGYGYKVPKPTPYQYDLINWRNLYFTSFYCFELADAYHRSLFRSKIDLLIASEWNKDTPYFSNIIESLSRDLHCYIAQVNTSQYGDTRLTQPTQTARKDILKLKGGRNDTILVGDLDIKSLREFQLKYFERIKADHNESFKPVPPDWDRLLVRKRINNEKINESTPDD